MDSTTSIEEVIVLGSLLLPDWQEEEAAKLQKIMGVFFEEDHALPNKHTPPNRISKQLDYIKTNAVLALYGRSSANSCRMIGLLYTEERTVIQSVKAMMFSCPFLLELVKVCVTIFSAAIEEEPYANVHCH